MSAVKVRIESTSSGGSRSKKSSDKYELTFGSKFKLGVSHQSSSSADGFGRETQAGRRSISVKSPNGCLTCLETYKGKKSQLHLEFKGNNLNFSDVFKEFQSSGKMTVFMDHEPKQAPHFFIVFASHSRNWRD